MKATQYFPHDAEYLDDPRIIKLIEKHKMAGYGILFTLYEILRKHENYRFHKSEIKMHCRRINVNTVLVMAILNDFDLFYFDGDYYYSDDLSQNMRSYDDKKRKNILKKEVEEMGNLLRLNQQKSEYDALLNDIELNRIKSNRIEGDEEKDVPATDTTFSDPNADFRTKPDADRNGTTDSDNNKNLVPDTEKQAQKKELTEMELGVDRAFRDQSWVEVIAMNQHIPVEYIHHIPLVSRVFKNHIIQQGKVRVMSDPEEAKRYFANFARNGTATRTGLDERMRLELRREVPYPFEDVDPATGVRRVCGVVIPRDAPPRPDNRKCWDATGKRWTD